MNVLIINCSPVRYGATAEIAKTAAEKLSEKYDVKSICIDDYSFAFCKGCSCCHNTAVCVIDDDIRLIISEFEKADIILSVAPSYWADIPGQFKAFIDRCTPWCNTHEPHASLSDKTRKGYVIALRTGPSMRECDRVIQSVEHFYGHLEIECAGSQGFCSIKNKEDVVPIKNEIISFCGNI